MRNQQGFTLVELLVAMAVFSFVLLIIVVGFMNLVNIHNAALASNQAQDSVRAAMDDMVQAVRDSTGVNSINTGVAPGVTGALGPNFDVVCLNSASGGPKEYFVKALASGNRQLWVRTGVCDSSALASPPDVPLTSADQSVEAFSVVQTPAIGLPPPTATWKPQVQITLTLGSGNGTTTAGGVNTKCNNNQQDRVFCSTATLTSGAAPR